VETERWKDKVTSLSPTENIKDIKTANPNFSGGDQHLDHLSKKVCNNDSEQLTLLWNTRPPETYNNLNLLHCIYLNKIKHLQNHGFNVTILVFDKYDREAKQLGSGENKTARNVAIDFANNIFNWGLSPSETEIILESNLRKSVNSDDFIEKIIELACQIDDEEIKNEGSKTPNTSEIIQNSIEIYYEKVINCDAILAGEHDLDRVWDVLRSLLVDEPFFPEYDEPLVLGLPHLEDDNGKALSPTKQTNTIHSGMDSKEIKDRIRESDSIRRAVCDYLIMPNEGCVEIGDRNCISYEEMKNYSDDDVAKILFDKSEKHFQI
jgi:hypothetical protein